MEMTRRACFHLLLSTLATLVPIAASAEAAGAWREVFQSSPADYDPVPSNFMELITEKLKLPQAMLEQWRPKPPVTGTVRFRFAVSGGGSQLRIRVSNEEGHAPLLVSAASVGVAADGFAAKPGSLRPLTFGGKRAIAVPAGAPVLSDPVAFALMPGSELVASVQIVSPHQFEPRGNGVMALAAGDQTLRDELEGATVMAGRPLITGAEIYAARAPRLIVTLGDSITDGNRSTLGELRGWPEELSRRFGAHRSGETLAVVNAGIGGNRVLTSGWGPSALARFDRDVLRVEGVSHVIILEGTNDIGMSGKSIFGNNPPIIADDLIAGYRQLTARAHGRGIKVILGTITPFGGSVSFTPEKDEVRQAVNRWIRTSNEADGVIDFDRIMGDSADPFRLARAYDIGDHLHPSEAGYKAMGDAIDLSIFD